MDKIKTGNLIREARIKKNYTQSELGDLLNVSNKAVSRWENGDSFPDVGILENLALVLDLKIQDIVSGEIGSEKDKSINDVLHIMKLQKVERAKKHIRYFLLGVIEVICLIAGYLGLRGRTDFMSTFYAAFFVSWICFMFVSAKGNASVEKNSKMDKLILVVAIILFAIVPVFSWAISALILNDEYFFGVEPALVGTIIETFFRIIFILNMLLLSFDSYGFIKEKTDVGIKNLFFIGTVLCVGIYCSLFYRIADRSMVYSTLFENTILVLGTFVATAAVSIGVKRMIDKYS